MVQRVIMFYVVQEYLYFDIIFKQLMRVGCTPRFRSDTDDVLYM